MTDPLVPDGVDVAYITPEMVKAAFDNFVLSASMRRLTDEAASRLAGNLNELWKRSDWERMLADDPRIVAQDRELRSSPVRKAAEKLLRLLTEEVDATCRRTWLFREPPNRDEIIQASPFLADNSPLRRLIRQRQSQFYKWTAWQEDLPALESWYREAVSPTNPGITFGTKGHLARFICWAVKLVHEREIALQDADVALREARSGKIRRRRNLPGKN